mgnify:CR=1 FL=1
MTHPGADRTTRVRDLPPMGHYARAAAVVIGVIALALLAWTTRGVLLMIFGGFLLAAGLDPMVRNLERRGMRRGSAVFLVVVVIVAGLIAFVVVALRPAIVQAAEFLLAIPDLLAPGPLEVDPAWVSEHITTRDLPVLGEVTCHTQASRALQRANTRHRLGEGLLVVAGVLHQVSSSAA